MKLGARKHFLHMLAVLAVGSTTFAIASTDTTRVAPRDELQSWINKNAVAVRSVDPMDEDFTDLEFLADVIGDAQVVQLGEASHGAGNSFAAKSRLVKFLHRRMGFDVLVWEGAAGIYGVRLTQAGMRGPEDALSAAQRGLMWWNNKELRPLLEYAKASQSSTRPLQMAGYDVMFSPLGYDVTFSPPPFDQFASSLRSFAAALRDAPVRKRTKDLVESALAAYNHICCAKDARPGQQEDLDNLHRAADVLLEQISTSRELFEQVHGARETSFMERAIESMRSDGTGKFYLAQATPETGELYFSKFWHQRDVQGARNLRWLIEEEYPGRKVIFWAHNVHVANAYFGPMFKDIHLESQPGLMKPVGVYLADWLGDKVYTIGLAYFEGEQRSLENNDIVPIATAPPGSLEARLHALGTPYLFLNLRAHDANPGHPLHKPQTMRLIESSFLSVPDITRVFSGIFYIERVTPATRGPGGN